MESDQIDPSVLSDPQGIFAQLPLFSNSDNLSDTDADVATDNKHTDDSADAHAHIYTITDLRDRLNAFVFEGFNTLERAETYHLLTLADKQQQFEIVDKSLVELATVIEQIGDTLQEFKNFSTDNLPTDFDQVPTTSTRTDINTYLTETESTNLRDFLDRYRDFSESIENSHLSNYSSNLPTDNTTYYNFDQSYNFQPQFHSTPRQFNFSSQNFTPNFNLKFNIMSSDAQRIDALNDELNRLTQQLDGLMTRYGDMHDIVTTQGQLITAAQHQQGQRRLGTKIQPPNHTHTAITPFSGFREEDFGEWLNSYEDASTAWKWNADDKRDSIPLYLRGPALTSYRGLSANDKATWDLLKAALENKFGRTTVKQYKTKELNLRRQQPYETVEQYIDALIRLANGVFDNQTPAGFRDSTLFSVFINGVSPELQQVLLFSGAKTLKPPLKLRWIMKHKNTCLIGHSRHTHAHL